MIREKVQKSILILAGEASGDIHGGSLVRELRKRRPGLRFFGIGGDRLEGEGVEIIHNVREMSFLGFLEVVKHLPFVRRVFREMVALLEERRPSLVVLIDYPGFNLRFARATKRLGFPVLYYISPQVWAWGRRRIKKIVRRVDRMIVIFPFEEDLYRKEGMEVRFVGHPLNDVVSISLSKGAFFEELGLDPARPTVGLLPGSRVQEVRRLLPGMIKACHLLRGKIPGLQSILGLAPTLSDGIYTPFLKEEKSLCPVRDRTYDVMAHTDVVMVASGTATLETAILGTPMVILYRMARLSFLLGRILVRLKHVGLVNIVAGRKIVPELLQGKATAERIAEEVFTLFSDEELKKEVKRDLEEVSRSLGKRGASERAAEVVEEFMDGNAL
jgi:lipid-A-disaccharide synthase